MAMNTDSYFRHLDAVAAAPSPLTDQIRMVMLPSSLIEGLDQVGWSREALARTDRGRALVRLRANGA
jgi:hypothetical protein